MCIVMESIEEEKRKKEKRNKEKFFNDRTGENHQIPNSQLFFFLFSRARARERGGTENTEYLLQSEKE